MMDEITKELQSFLVRLHYNPDSVSDKMEHYLEHLIRLLMPNEEEALLHYFGILEHEQYSLDEIARQQKLSPEVMMTKIDESLRKLAITPEWQMMRSAISS